MFNLTTVCITPDVVELKFKDFVLKYDPEVIAQAEYEKVRIDGRTSEGGQFDHVFDSLIQFIYRRIEKDRRRAIANLVQALEEANGDGEKLQDAIGNHLAKNSFSGQLAALSRRSNEIDWWSVLDEVRSPEDITQVLAAARRTLESSAEHPGVLVYRGRGRLTTSCQTKRNYERRLSRNGVKGTFRGLSLEQF